MQNREKVLIATSVMQHLYLNKLNVDRALIAISINLGTRQFGNQMTVSMHGRTQSFHRL
jgi:hypothetical protein